MKKSLKVALFSALVFPGSGHFILKKKWQAIILASSAGYCIYVIASLLYAQAQKITEQIVSGELSPTVAAITEAMSNQPISEVETINTATTVIIIVWLIGMIDAYRIAHSEEKKHKLNNSGE